MGSLDGRSNLSLESEERSSRGKSMTESQREKRKSEVLIAAQSIENEVQSVKSLKRISIGSIDLLIDPEMEFRVSNPSKRKSWSSNSSSSGDEADLGQVPDSNRGVNELKEESDDTMATEGLENSFEVTSADYLQSFNSSQESPEAEDSTSFLQRCELSQTSMRRTLTGAGSLRRGGVGTSTGESWSQASENDGGYNNSGSSITNQLFWVPANQHPNVKPENYLELVQDTLHNIRLDDKDEKPNHDENSDSNFAGFERKPLDIARKRDSLVRRPSLLRKSYTEFEDYSDEEEENRQKSLQKAAESGRDFKKVSRSSKRAVSLKDITEELNKISNNAGLTSSDAITLARTLSMAGTYSNINIDSTVDSSTTSGQRSSAAHDATSINNEDESEFASNMLTRHGVVIPARSSLRRSKFNTYRIRSSGSITSSDDGDKNTEQQSASKIEHKPTLKHQETISAERTRKQANLASSNISPVKQPDSTAASPNTINDFQDIYDHYRQPSVDWEKELDKESTEQAQIEIPEAHEKSHKKDPKSSTTDSKTEKGSSVPILDRIGLEKKTGWSWLNGITSRESHTGKPPKSEERDVKPLQDESSVIKDSEKVSDATRARSDKLSNHRINHSKNRHLPLFNANEPAKPDPQPKGKEMVNTAKETNVPTTDSSNLKRQKFEKKFVNLFKRRARNKSTGHKSPKNVVKGDARGSVPLENQTKNDVSFKHSRLKSESGAEEQLRSAHTSMSRASSSGDVQDHWDTPGVEVDQLPALQPAVSVTSTKSNYASVAEPSVVESVRELDGDDSQDISGDQSANSGIDLMQEALVMKEQAREESDLSVPDKHVMPPRKLTFDDVKRPERPNAAMKFTDSAFGFPLPMLTVSTVIMFDHRLPINVERAIYRLSHLKLSDPKRELRQQVILSNFMYAYLNLVNHTLYMEQVAQEDSSLVIDSSSGSSAISNKGATYQTEHNSANGSICIPDI